MFARSRSERPPLLERLAQWFPEQATALADPWYALPPSLVIALGTHAPGLLTPSEVKFERRLAHLVGQGIDRDGSIGSTDLMRFFPRPRSFGESRALDERARSSDRELEALSAEIDEKEGRNRMQVEKAKKDVQLFELELWKRRLGYLGWLVTCVEYQEELAQLKLAWGARLAEQGNDFPALPISLFGERPPSVPKEDRELYSDFITFYERWGLESLVTWDVAEPMRPGAFGPHYYAGIVTEGCGVNLMLPWYMFRRPFPSLEKMIAHEKLMSMPRPLRNWVNNSGKRQGLDYWARLYCIFIFRNLALVPRYGGRPKFIQERVDLAFSHFFWEADLQRAKPDTGVEIVRKIRTDLGAMLSGQPKRRRRSKRREAGSTQPLDSGTDAEPQS